MPSKSAKKPWEIEQEKNIMYVAYTRPRNVLGFLDERDFEKYKTYDANNKKRLKRIEEKVNNIFGITPKKILNKEIAQAIIEKSKPIVFHKPSPNNIKIADTVKPKENSLLTVLNKPKIKRIKRH